MTETESNAVFVIMWELAKLDGKPIQIGNQELKPTETERGHGFNSDKFQVVVDNLQQRPPFHGAKRYLQIGKENQAREVLKFHYPELRSMRDVMWEKLFRFLIPKSDVERIREILR